MDDTQARLRLRHAGHVGEVPQYVSQGLIGQPPMELPCEPNCVQQPVVPSDAQACDGCISQGLGHFPLRDSATFGHAAQGLPPGEGHDPGFAASQVHGRSSQGSCGDELLAKPQMHSAVHGGHHPVHGLLHRSDLVRRKLVMLAMAAWHGYGLALRDRHCAATMVGPSGGHAPQGPAQPLQGCVLGPIGGLLYRAEQARRKLLIMVVFGWQRLCRRPRGAKASTATCARAPQVAEGPRSDQRGWRAGSQAASGPPRASTEGWPGTDGAVFSPSLSLSGSQADAAAGRSGKK